MTNNIIISLSGKASGHDVLISSGPGTVTPPPALACQDMLTGMTTSTPLGDLTLISTNWLFPASVVVDIAGTQYTVSDGITTSVPGGELSVSGISFTGARVCLALSTPPPSPSPSPSPWPGPGGILPPPPVLNVCVLPELSWNFVEVVRQAVTYISCNLGNLILQVSWLVSALAALIPQLLAGIAYFLSLKWITDWIQSFFTQLDIWLSGKFGIDPNLPFFEELVKKALNWISGALDTAAGIRIRERKW